MNTTLTTTDARQLLSRLLELRSQCLLLETEQEGRITALEQAARDAHERGVRGPVSGAAASTRNLLHYLALRREDLRDLHAPLAELGLSSLGRIEPHVMANLNAVIGVLSRLVRTSHGIDAGTIDPREQLTPQAITLSEAQSLLERRATALLGGVDASDDSVTDGGESTRTDGGTRIMVTLPSEAADGSELVRALLDAGMNCARINTAHDDPERWERMCRHVRTEAAAAAIDCRILMDVSGPKLRTGPMEPGPEVVRIKPLRDPLGRVISPATVVLRESGGDALAASEIPVDGAWLHSLRAGDDIVFVDTRSRRRALRVRSVDETHGICRVTATCYQTAYIGSGMRLQRLREGEYGLVAHVGRLRALAQAIVVRPGDRLNVALDREHGKPADGNSPAILTTTMPDAFRRVTIGDAVWIDDGRVGATVVAVRPHSVELRVVQAAAGGDVIREDKGINLPDTDIGISGLTPEDVAILPIVARNADMVGISFVCESPDVRAVRERLDALGGANVGTVLKIETRRAFENLPSLLLEALRGPSAGVMIARGDLAVEVGYHRLAEVQEEILWLCEAAHLPVIWATQVLETMAKKGRPSRAEVTDAAMGERAECVMLNKGPFVVDAVRFLVDLLQRMQDHQSKKRPLLRSLSVARRFGKGSENAAAKR